MVDVESRRFVVELGVSSAPYIRFMKLYHTTLHHTTLLIHGRGQRSGNGKGRSIDIAKFLYEHMAGLKIPGTLSFVSHLALLPHDGRADALNVLGRLICLCVLCLFLTRLSFSLALIRMYLYDSSLDIFSFFLCCLASRIRRSEILCRIAYPFCRLPVPWPPYRYQ